MYYNAKINAAIANSNYILLGILVYYSENLRYLPMWYLKSPPVNKSITKYKFSLS